MTLAHHLLLLSMSPRNIPQVRLKNQSCEIYILCGSDENYLFVFVSGNDLQKEK